MRSEYMVKRETPVSQTACEEVVKVHARAVARRTFRSPIVRKSIGAEVTGMTACPCAQNIMKERAMRVLEGLDVNKDKIDEFFAQYPWPPTTSVARVSSVSRLTMTSMWTLRKSSNSQGLDERRDL